MAIRAWVLYANDVQLDLVALPRGAFNGATPESVALYDPDGVMVAVEHPLRLTTPERAEEWVFMAWHALTEVDKCIRRDRLVDALEWLGLARGHYLSLYAVAMGTDYAAHIHQTAARFDTPESWPPGIETTAPGLERKELLTSALSLAGMLDQLAPKLGAVGAQGTRPLAAWTRGRLESLAGRR